MQGRIDNDLIYSATISGRDIRQAIYNHELGSPDEESPQADKCLRLFAEGNELTIKQQGVFHSGCGGTFCEYMFGIQVPADDFLRDDILNRLVVFGTKPGKKALQFSEKTERLDTYEEMFRNGHLFCNYYFFVTFPEQANPTSIAEKQRQIVLMAGKSIKRAAAVADYTDAAMQGTTKVLQEALHSLGGIVFLVRIFNQRIYEFYLGARELGKAKPQIFTNRENFFDAAQKLSLGEQSSERLRLDLAYKLTGNREIIDQYKKLLSSAQGSVTKMDEVRRLKIVCLRSNIPKELLTELEAKLPESNYDIYRTEPMYIQEARAVLEDYVLNHSAELLDKKDGKLSLPYEAIRRVFNAKFHSDQEGSKSFEQLLLDYTHRIDVSDDGKAKELLKQIFIYLDGYDDLSRTFNNLAFVDGATVDEKTVASLSSHYKAVASASMDDFNSFLILPIVENLYAIHFGKEKLHALLEALENPDTDKRLVETTVQRINAIRNEERVYTILNEYIRNNIKVFYIDSKKQEEREKVRRSISNQLKNEGKLDSDISASVFNQVLQDLHLESIYLNDILPAAILADDWGSREEFIRNSTLDQHRVEEIERSYCRRHNLDENYVDIMIDASYKRGKSAVELDL